MCNKRFIIQRFHLIPKILTLQGFESFARSRNETSTNICTHFARYLYSTKQCWIITTCISCSTLVPVIACGGEDSKVHLFTEKDNKVILLSLNLMCKLQTCLVSCWKFPWHTLQEIHTFTVMSLISLNLD